MQSTGHASIQRLHKVQLQGSIEYSLPLVITAFSGQTKRQLSQAIHMDEISKKIWAIILL